MEFFALESNTSARQPERPVGKRPMWLRVLIWIGVAFLLFNTVGVLLFFLLENRIGKITGAMVPLLLVAATLAVPTWRWHGRNVLRTWGNKATAEFTRRDDPATGGHLFHVQPARAARMPALPLFVMGLLLLLAYLSSGIFWLYIFALVFLGVGCAFVLPGARHRRPVTISVSPHGVQSGDIGVPLRAVADLQVGHDGLVVDPDAPMPGPNGVPISSTLGRAMGRRQEKRGYAVTIRADGESQHHTLAGGLTEDCARALAADIGKAIRAGVVSA